MADTHLLLLHGALGASGQFNDLMNTLDDYTGIHCFNFIGHGGSELPLGLKMPDLVNQLQRFIEESIPKDVHLTIFGYSMGGYAALLLASMNEVNIDRIITLGTKLNWNPEIAAKEIKMLNPEIMEQKIPAFATELKQRHAPQDWKQVLRLTGEMMVDLGMEQYLSLAAMEKISVPVKLMLGDKDNMVSVEETLLAYKTIPNASLSILPNTPHPIERVSLERLKFELKRNS